MEKRPGPEEESIATRVWKETLVAYESFLTEKIAEKHKAGEIDDDGYKEWLDEVSEYTEPAQFEGFAEQELGISAYDLNRAVEGGLHKLDKPK